MSTAAQFRAQIPASTDPAFLERMARHVEGNPGPRRIQRQRRRGWRMPPGAVYVGRPTQWGNEYELPGRLRGYINDAGDVVILPNTRDNVVAWFRASAVERHETNPNWLAPLRGKDLACWCRLDELCHADVLLKLANKVPA